VSVHVAIASIQGHPIHVEYEPVTDLWAIQVNPGDATEETTGEHVADLLERHADTDDPLYRSLYYAARSGMNPALMPGVRK